MGPGATWQTSTGEKVKKEHEVQKVKEVQEVQEVNEQRRRSRGTQLFRSSILVCGGSVIDGVYPI